MTKEETFLRSVALPKATDTYTVISHGHIIDKVRAELKKNRFEIQDESYITNDSGEEVLAKVYLKTEKDPDMGMIFTWWNSYNKRIKFGCAVGSFIYDNHSSLIGSEGMSWIRKHTGTADQEADNILEQLIGYADSYFDKIITEKNQMLSQPLTVEDFGCLMGALYFEHELITTTQASAIKSEYKKPENEYTNKDTLWGLYKLIMFGIEKGDFRKWVKSQQKLHHMIMTEYLINQKELEGPGLEEEPFIGETKEVSVEEAVEKFGDAMVEPLKSDQELPLSNISEDLPKKEEYFDWNIQGSKPEVIAIEDGVAQPLEEVADLSQVDVVVEMKTVSKRTAVRMQCLQLNSEALVDYWMGEHYDDAKTLEENVNAFKDWAPEASEKKTEETPKDERQEWADKVLEDGPQDEHVGPPEMYTEDDVKFPVKGVIAKEPIVFKADDVLDAVREDLESKQLNTPDESFKPVNTEFEVIKEEDAEIIINADESDSEIEAELNSIFADDPEQSVEVEEEEKSIVETKAEENLPKEKEEVVSEVKPVANLKEPVEIMSPEESKEKASEEFIFPTDLDNQEKLEKVLTEEGRKDEEEDFFEVEEHDGLKVPEGVVAQASAIEKKMTLLYGSVRSYQVKETDSQINVTIDETFEGFVIKK